MGRRVGLDQNQQSVEMQFLRKLDKKLRKHMVVDERRFAQIEIKLGDVRTRLNVLIALVVAIIPAVYFGAHP